MLTQPTRQVEASEVPQPLPLPVAPDWSDRARRAEAMTRLVDRHLDYEERGRRLPAGHRLRPVGLCPDQRVQRVTDLYAVTR